MRSDEIQAGYQPLEGDVPMDEFVVGGKETGKQAEFIGDQQIPSTNGLNFKALHTMIQ